MKTLCATVHLSPPFLFLSCRLINKLTNRDNQFESEPLRRVHNNEADSVSWWHSSSYRKKVKASGCFLPLTTLNCRTSTWWSQQQAGKSGQKRPVRHAPFTPGKCGYAPWHDLQLWDVFWQKRGSSSSSSATLTASFIQFEQDAAEISTFFSLSLSRQSVIEELLPLLSADFITSWEPDVVANSFSSCYIFWHHPDSVDRGSYSVKQRVHIINSDSKLPHSCQPSLCPCWVSFRLKWAWLNARLRSPGLFPRIMMVTPRMQRLFLLNHSCDADGCRQRCWLEGNISGDHVMESRRWEIRSWPLIPTNTWETPSYICPIGLIVTSHGLEFLLS